MINFNVPKVESYEKGIPRQVWDVYKKLHHDNSYKIEMDIFEDRDKAVEVFKAYLDRGAITFSHFTADYSKFVIFRNSFTDEVIKKKQKEKADKEAKTKMNSDGKEK